MVPDLEKIVSAHLRDATGVRVVGQPPDDKTSAWVRVTLLDAPQNDVADHFVDALMQFDCYSSKAGTDGSPQKEAVNLARTLRASLQALPGVHGDDVISGVKITGHTRIPDTDLKPARERVVITATVWAHS